MQKFKVIFYPHNKTVEVEKDKTILSAALSAGIYINSACGGDGVCGRCKVIVKKGDVSSSPTGMLTAGEKQQNVYLACLALVQSDLEVEIPKESLPDFDNPQPDGGLREKGVYSEIEDIEPGESAQKDVFSGLPLTSKLYLQLPPADLDDKISDLERIQRQIKKQIGDSALIIDSDIADIRGLSHLLRSSEWKVTVTLGWKHDVSEIILIEPGDTSGSNYGFCFDIGTTTISGQLIDLNRGRIIGTKAAYNKQAGFGSDIITRIIYASDPEGLERLHCAAVASMNQMIQEFIAENKIDLNSVTCVACAGNTTMMHLLLRIDPQYIRKQPYVATANFLPAVRAVDSGIKINPRGLLYCMPGVASYVGADITSGVLSCEIYKQPELSILVDIGTNGEIVLGNKEFLIACAASAGPAFEGSGVKCGMRAAKGAIDKAVIRFADGADIQVEYNTIGGCAAKGICGSGYIDILAGMLESGIMDKDGKIKDIKHNRIRTSESGKEFIIVPMQECGLSEDIVITEADVENLKRAKAAVYSAITILLKHVNLDLSAVKRIFIAGNFGFSLDMDNAVKIGLLPDLERQRFVFAGNTSLSGTVQVLLSKQALKKTDEIARSITYLELSVEPDYMNEYMAALFFPHTDLTRFASFKNTK